MEKKFKFILICIGSISLLVYLWYACRVVLPSSEQPLLFYSNQTRQDIYKTFHRAIEKASQSVFLSVYGLSDPAFIKLLQKKEQENLYMRIEYDKSASSPLTDLLACALPIKTKGLMHRKIAVIDHATTFLGSANFTTTSLHHHSNLVIGFYHEGLAKYLERPFSNVFSFTVDTTRGTLFLLPDPSGDSFEHLLNTIHSAHHTIQIAMFTLTHPLIVDALIAAKRRGVKVSIAIDYYTARGASKKSLDRLLAEGISCYYSQGKELLHYKWAFIDHEIFIMGSANWTSAAFQKNQDFLLFLESLCPKQQQFIESLWEIITTEALRAQ